MRILSWNVNSIRTLPEYYPWSELKTFEAIFDKLEADIICLQEMKVARGAPDKGLAVPGRFDAFFSFPTSKTGYSGVAVYTDPRTAIPLRAEEGLSGLIQPKPPLTPDERVSTTYPAVQDLALLPEAAGGVPADLAALDGEGRTLVLDFGLFVLVNVYCPNETSDARLPFKMNFHLMLDARVRGLIAAGREVVVLGDINICAAPIDHCDGEDYEVKRAFYEHPARAWFREWLDVDAGGCMVDVVRRFWPDKEGMYTCWDLRTAARDTNYGTRIDYILATPGLLPWIKHGDIQQDIKGSDHCPIYIDLHDEITLPSGATATLREAMHMSDTPRAPPRIAARNWKEFSGKQKLISTFFGKRSSAVPQAMSSTASSSSSLSAQSRTLLTSVTLSPPPCMPTSEVEPKPKPLILTASSSKRKLEPLPVPRKKQKKGSTNLAMFFADQSTSKRGKPKHVSKGGAGKEVIVVSDDEAPTAYAACTGSSAGSGTV